ncbi:hypothetical protein [Cellulomonas pakistanensis]|uniref:Uncharacterized protein n=1 Tax=Cellulomonas pakistanensis TaxID=992287 RepID=A0A919P899_9CELL|nr:hypothetical protein [Cellulomonas pakistanensis]GIG34938.1 hypothetical protein Cpa01nite_03190 [Cellulomonas pakistanensis]
MLPEAPSSDYALLTLIIVVTGVVPFVVTLAAPRLLRRDRGTAAPRRPVPAWALVAVPVVLVAWWFVAAWLFLAD